MYIIKAQAKTPTEFVFLETAALPLSYIVSSRRMIYLQHILKRDKNELLKRVYIAQKENPTEGDFAELVKKDFELLGEVIDENKIEAMDSKTYKDHIKAKIREIAFKDLTTIQATHVKVQDIKYNKLEIQAYMLSPLFSSKEVEKLAALRSHSIRGIKKNFSSWYKPNLACPMGCLAEDNQPHLRFCGPLLADLNREQKDAIKHIKYEDIYGSLDRQKAAITVFSWLLDARDRLLDAAKPASGASLDAAPPPPSDGVYTNVHH